MTAERCDIVVIGGGILGTATAMQLTSRFPRYRVVVLEKESQLAAHQSGHNSGVIHSGIYYRPGSLKARNSIDGVRDLLVFCDQHGIRYDLCGKLIVATRPDELPRLDELYRRGIANGVPGLEIVDVARLREIEPYAAGIKGLYSPQTGIVDYAEVTRAYAGEVISHGGEVLLGTGLQNVRQHGAGILLKTSHGEIETACLINCAGLHADVVAGWLGARLDTRIVPFRGEYYRLRPEAHRLVRGLIYPAPDPEFPFLGVHFTRSIHGGVEAGPNAVLALARQGYTKTSINVRESLNMFSYGGFWTMARRYWRTGVQEGYRSYSKQAFTRGLQRLVPDVRADDLEPAGAGVRAQAVDQDGRLVDDFRIVESPNAIHVLNAPSPGATASLAISANIALMAEKSFGLSR